ncbi:MAG: response regulator [Leadbetterella sp.]
MIVHLIEDETLLLKMLDFKLKSEFLTVSTSSNGLEAIELLKKSLPDVIVTDIMMPMLNGLEVVSFVRNELKLDIPIIVLSSAKHQKIVDEAISIGANDFISKPFNPQQLVDKIIKLHSAA